MARPITHGLTLLHPAVKEVGQRCVDPESEVGKALAAWRNELLADLGGVEAVSTQELSIVELAVRSKLMLDSIDAWLLAQPCLINRRKRTLLPVIPQRTQLADALARYLAALGLKRRAQRDLTLAEYLQQPKAAS